VGPLVGKNYANEKLDAVVVGAKDGMSGPAGLPRGRHGLSLGRRGGTIPNPPRRRRTSKPAVDNSKKTTDVKPAADTPKKTPDAKPAADTEKKAPDAKPAVEGGKEEGAGALENRDRRITGYTRPGVPDDKIVNGIIPAAPPRFAGRHRLLQGPGTGHRRSGRLLVAPGQGRVQRQVPRRREIAAPGQDGALPLPLPDLQ